MMATSKHPIKQQDELFSVLRRRYPYICQGIPCSLFNISSASALPRNHWPRAAPEVRHNPWSFSPWSRCKAWQE